MHSEYRFGYEDRELQRLGDRHKVWADTNRALLERAGFAPGHTVVDLGCGPGFTTLDLARAVGPSGSVIAVDRDGEKSLPLLMERAAAAGLENIEVRTSDLEDFNLPDGSVDGVFSRWALMYLSEPDAFDLVGRIASWLRPGGRCALVEFCNFRHMHVHPPCHQLEAIADALMRSVEGGRGCNPQIGNEIPGRLVNAGMVVEIRVATLAVRAGTPGWSWPDSLFREHLSDLVDNGYLDREVLDTFWGDWDNRSNDPSALFFGSPVMESIGRKL